MNNRPTIVGIAGEKLKRGDIVEIRISADGKLDPSQIIFKAKAQRQERRVGDDI